MEGSIKSIFEYLFNQEKTHITDMKNADKILCFSDYAGDNSIYNMYSFLFVDYNQSRNLHSKIDELRKSEKEWKNKSWIEYKKFKKDRVRRRILPQFLNINSDLKGNLFLISVDKSIDNMVHNEGTGFVNDIVEKLGYGTWTTRIIKRQLDVLIFQSLLCSQIIDFHQDYVWVSDRDAINDEGKGRVDNMIDLLSQFFKLFNVKYKSAGFATNANYDENDNYYGDMLAIPDLVSGATLEFMEEKYGTNKLKVTSYQTLEWFHTGCVSLSKNHFHLSEEDGRIKLELKTIEFPACL